jgi:AraC family transcriptional regulator of adaptative response / DNA-3-methyladenine glycosylase II
MTSRLPDRDACLRAVASRDRRFDGVFYTAVSSTGIYCRPSCPARTPLPGNTAFYPSAAAAQSAGYRACRRCLPDATPGSPHWDVAADAAGRAMRLISDGVVEREGVPGLARRVGYTPRHLNRLLVAELGAGPLALARARRAQTARSLIEATALPLSEVAFAAGFSSVRQFNDTIREVYASTPGELRGRRRSRTATVQTNPTAPAGTGELNLRLAVRTPFDGPALARFLAPRALPGVELVEPDAYSRTLSLPHGPGRVRVELPDLPAEPAGATATIPVRFHLADLRDLSAAVERVRRLLDADADPVAVLADLGADPLLAPLLRRHPGLRVPGHTDGAELAVRAVVGQQISVVGARTVLARLVAAHGAQLPADPTAPRGLTHLFPTSAALAGLDPDVLPMPRARGRALVALCRALADGELTLDRGPDRRDVAGRLLALPGIGPWTASYLAIRALGDPDAFMPTDLGTRDALLRLGRDPRAAAALAEPWRPWRSYAQAHLWHLLLEPEET